MRFIGVFKYITYRIYGEAWFETGNDHEIYTCAAPCGAGHPRPAGWPASATAVNYKYIWTRLVITRVVTTVNRCSAHMHNDLVIPSVKILDSRSLNFP